MKAIYLYPHSSFVTKLQSDTLSGLILSILKVVYSEELLLEWLKDFDDGNPPFIVSSAFPFYKDKENKITHFLPKPMRSFAFSELNEVEKTQSMDYLKEYKKFNLVPKEIFEQIINGELSEVELFKSNLWQDKKPKIVIKNEHILKTSIDRLTSSTAEDEKERGLLHYSQEYYFDIQVGDKENVQIKKAGLYFLIKAENDIIEHIEAVFRFLQHFGIGGDNTSGKGHFTYEIKDFELKQPSNAQTSVLLSLLSPSRENLQKIKAYKSLSNYNLTIRKGRVGTHFINTGKSKKDAVVAFTEGSILPLNPEFTNGSVKIVNREIDNVKIRFVGYGFCLPIKYRN